MLAKWWMNSDGTITVTSLGKAYKQYPTRWSRLAEWVTPGHRNRHALKWVLQDINLTVNHGEALGIIGINDAGKNTLLKMITGTTQPTTGGVHMTGCVATAHRPDVLIVDEALSVGDAYLQHKSFDSIREFRKQGTTLLIVSHDKGAIQSICDRAIMLNVGRLAMEGEPEAVMDYYNAMLADHQNQSVKHEVTIDRKIQTISGTGEVKLTEIALLDAAGEEIEMVAVGQAVSLYAKAACNAQVEELVVGYMIKDRLSQPVFGTNTYHHKRQLQNLRDGETIEFSIDFEAHLGPGTYSVAIAPHTDGNHVAKKTTNGVTMRWNSI
jgi:ABC-type polysaccharide/polyol phosphate transport system ATPase subunit